MHPYKLRISYRTIHILPCHRHAHTQRYRPHACTQYPIPNTQHPIPNTHTHCHTFDSIPLHCIPIHSITLHCTTLQSLQWLTLHFTLDLKLFWEVFFPFCFFSLDFLFCPFSLLFTGFWRWKRYLPHFWVRTFHFPWNLQHFGAIAAFGAGCCNFNGIYNMFEFEPLIFDEICNIVVLELFL